VFGLIGSIRAVDGGRGALAAILGSIGPMPGCLSYVVAEDANDPDLLWVTEVWESADAHAASLDLEEVRAAIGRGRPLIAGFETRIETTPAGGIGLT
jgi:quinol monooxygenase YgiN